jgi:hypothetical protein
LLSDHEAPCPIAASASLDTALSGGPRQPMRH